MRRIVAVVACGGLLGGLAAGLLGGLVPAAVAGASPTGGAEKVWVTPSPTGTSVKHPGKVMLTGAFADYGKSVSANASGKPSKNGTYKLLTLEKGTILVNGSELNAAFKNLQPQTFSQTTCSGDAHISAPVTLVKGTKAYVGISGTFTITATFAFITAKTKSGSCTMKTTSPGLATYSSVTGSGTVSFSS